MSLPHKTTILIVGAGPTGLAASLSLLHHGIRNFIIVDAVPQGENVSRAVVIHAATLKLLDTIGCGDDIASQGTKSPVLNIGTRSTKLISPRFDSLKSYTRHPYSLAITQNVTERVLEKKLASFGVIVHRPLKVVGLTRNAANPQLSDVTFEDGRVITTEYVIGADGARSVVRTMAGIDFSDPMLAQGEAGSYLSQSVIADVTFDSDITDTNDDDMPSIVLSRKGFFIWHPLPFSYNESLALGRQVSTERIYRIGCDVPLEEGEIPHSAPRGYLQDLVDRFGPYRLASDPAVNPNSKPICIQDVIWSSHFRTHAAIADTMFSRLGHGELGDGGVILLIGDAAHIHPPAGGQGMNLGLRDAVFLGEALANHIRAAVTKPLSEADVVLHEFARVRHARALEVVRITKGILSGMKYHDRTFWWCPIDSATVRVWVLWVLGRIPFVQRKMAWELSGLGRS